MIPAEGVSILRMSLSISPFLLRKTEKAFSDIGNKLVIFFKHAGRGAGYRFGYSGANLQADILRDFQEHFFRLHVKKVEIAEGLLRNLSSHICEALGTLRCGIRRKARRQENGHDRSGGFPSERYCREKALKYKELVQ